MSDKGITINLDAGSFRKKLQKDLVGLPAALTLGLATKLQEVISPYPSYSPQKTPGKTYYQRGFGTIYVKKSGGVTKRKVSEMMGRKWDIIPAKNRATLRNKASYSAFVHSSTNQAKIHSKRGWETEETALEQIDTNKLFDAIIDKLLKV